MMIEANARRVTSCIIAPGAFVKFACEIRIRVGANLHVGREIDKGRRESCP